jgi:hypothetical protein
MRKLTSSFLLVVAVLVCGVLTSPSALLNYSCPAGYDCISEQICTYQPTQCTLGNVMIICCVLCYKNSIVYLLFTSFKGLFCPGGTAQALQCQEGGLCV